MPKSRVNGTGLYWEIEGAGGDPLVLVHGSWGDHGSWEPVVPALSQSFRVLTYDRRGHSRSDRTGGQGSVREDAADLAALLTALEHHPAHIVGNSFGGSIVLRLAAERPELCRSLIVHEPPLFGLLKDDLDAQAALSVVEERMSAVASLLAAGELTEGTRRFIETIAMGPGSWEELSEEKRKTLVFNALTWLDEVRDPEALEFVLEELHGFAAPALLTQGDRSPPFFPLVVGRVASALPNSRTTTYVDAGHVPYLTDPEGYVRVLTEFIGGVGTPE